MVTTEGFSEPMQDLSSMVNYTRLNCVASESNKNFISLNTFVLNYYSFNNVQVDKTTIRIGGAKLSIASSSIIVPLLATRDTKGYCTLRLAQEGSQLEEELKILGPYPDTHSVLKLLKKYPEQKVKSFKIVINNYVGHIIGKEEFVIITREQRLRIGVAWNSFFNTLAHTGHMISHLGHMVGCGGDKGFCGEIFEITEEAAEAFHSVKDLMELNPNDDPVNPLSFESMANNLRVWGNPIRPLSVNEHLNTVEDDVTHEARTQNPLADVSYRTEDLYGRGLVAAGEAGCIIGGLLDELWITAIKELRETHSMKIWPEGECYQVLFDHRVELGRYPTGSDIFYNREARVAMIRNDEKVVYWRRFETCIHLSNVPFEGSVKITVGTILSYISRDDKWMYENFGGTTHGYCYKILFENCPNMGFCPTIQTIMSYKLKAKKPAFMVRKDNFVHVSRTKVTEQYVELDWSELVEAFETKSDFQGVSYDEFKLWRIGILPNQPYRTLSNVVLTVLFVVSYFSYRPHWFPTILSWVYLVTDAKPRNLVVSIILCFLLIFSGYQIKFNSAVDVLLLNLLFKLNSGWLFFMISNLFDVAMVFNNPSFYYVLIPTVLWLVHKTLRLMPFTQLRKIDFITFGSRGDVIPLRPYQRILRELGFDVSIVDCLSPKEGSSLLRELEHGHLLGCAKDIPKLVDAVNGSLKAGNLPVAPLDAMGCSDSCVTYSYVPPPQNLGMFRAYGTEGSIRCENTWFVWFVNICSEVITTIGPPDVRIGAFEGCAPRSPDGETFLQPRKNKKTGKTLLAFGSSSLHEPDNLDPNTTRSTRCLSIYQTETNTNHQEVFPNYDTVICHGGAGTAQTAKACGCEVVSKSNLIDRDIQSWDGFEVTSDYTWFLVGLFQKLTIIEKLWLLPALLRLADFRVLLKVFIHGYLLSFTTFSARLLCLLFYLRDLVTQLLISPSITHALLLLLSGDMIPASVSGILAATLAVAVKYALHKSKLDNCLIVGLSLIEVIWDRINSDVFWFCLPLAGPVISIMLSAICRSLKQNVLPMVIKTLTAITGYLFSLTLEADDKLKLRFTRLHSYPMFGFPFCHLELFDAQHNISIGVAVKDGLCESYIKEGASGEVLWELPTSIPIEKLPEIRTNLRKFDGKLYHMFMNCQTTLITQLNHKLLLLLVLLVCACGSFGMILVGTFLGLQHVFFFVRSFDAFSLPSQMLYQAQGTSIDASKQFVQDCIFGDKLLSANVEYFKQKIEVNPNIQGHITLIQTHIEGLMSKVPFGQTKVILLEDLVSEFEFPFNKAFILTGITSFPITNKRRLIIYTAGKDMMLGNKLVAHTPKGNYVLVDDEKHPIGLILQQEGDINVHMFKPSKLYDLLVSGNDRLSSALFGENKPLNYVFEMLATNARVFVKRIRRAQKRLFKEDLLYVEFRKILPTLRLIDDIICEFEPEQRKVKPAWAPLLENSKYRRVEELNETIADQAVFIDPGFHNTLHHYVSFLNEKRGVTRGKPLSLGEFRRFVNRSPHIDLVLNDRFQSDDCPDGVDGQIFACKEVMIATMARYVGTNTVDALTLEEKSDLAKSIVNSAPHLYEDAKLANPKRLLNHWMKHKNFSSGTPFMMNDNTGKPQYKTRSEVKRAGWFEALESLSTLPLTSGVWFPSIAHVFPKSQVIAYEKLQQNPAKLRSVTATSIIDNLQKGVLNYEINNRHDFSTSSKPGMPLTGAYMSTVFEELNRYSFKFSADITQMDSNLSQGVFAVEAEIRKLGFKNKPYYDAICSHIEAMMQKTQQGYLINLITEDAETVRKTLDEYHSQYWDNVNSEGWDRVKQLYETTNVTFDKICPGGRVRKQKGGYTGDSDTTWTNTVGLQIILISSFAKYYGCSFEEATKLMFVANVGDDNLLGVNLPDFNPVKFQKFVETMHGVVMRYEGQGDIESQTFLGKRAVHGYKYKKEFQQFNIPVPKFAVIHDAKMLKTRYYNFKSEASRYFKRQKTDSVRVLRYLVARGIGAIQLTAHQKKLYDEIRRDIDKNTRKLQKIRPSALKSLKTPTYEKVMKDWYKKEDKPTFKELKFALNPFSVLVNNTSSLIRDIESFILGINPTIFTIEPPTTMSIDLIEQSTYIFEEHAYLTFIDKNGKEPTPLDLEMVLRQSPFSAFVSIKNFIDHRLPQLSSEGPAFRELLRRAKLRFVIYSLIYLASNKILNLVSYLPAGDLILQLFNFYIKTLPQVYATANYLHFIENGSSSSTISAMIPKDVYYHHKAIALAITESIPLELEKLPIDIGYVTKTLDMISVQLSRLLSLRVTYDEPLKQSGSSVIPEVWMDAARDAMKTLLQGKAPIIIAPTGTGKTRWFPQALKCLAPIGTMIIICLPRKVLCESMAAHGMHYKNNTNGFKEGIQCCTYGHISMILATGGINKLPRNAIYLLDECHESAIEIGYLKNKLIGTESVCLMTATPDVEDPEKTKQVIVPVKSPYIVEKFEAHGYNAAELFMTVIEPGDRILVIHPTKSFGEKLKLTLQQHGYKIENINSEKRRVPEDQNVHLVATSIVDAGINIEGVTKVIDAGYMLVNDGGELSVRYVNKTVSTQRAGRTGRFCNGSYYVMAPIKEESWQSTPSIDQIMGGSPLAEGLYKTKLEKRPKEAINGLVGNLYATIDARLKRNELISLSLWHSLELVSTSQAMVMETYKRTSQGLPCESTEYFMTSNGVLSSQLISIEEILVLKERVMIYYFENGSRVFGKPAVMRGEVVMNKKPLPPKFSNYPDFTRDNRSIIPIDSVQG